MHSSNFFSFIWCRVQFLFLVYVKKFESVCVRLWRVQWRCLVERSKKNVLWRELLKNVQSWLKCLKGNLGKRYRLKKKPLKTLKHPLPTVEEVVITQNSQRPTDTAVSSESSKETNSEENYEPLIMAQDLNEREFTGWRREA